MTSFPTGTVTFLFSDIEGSTRLWEQSPEKMEPALESHDRIMRQAISDAGGYIFATGGDAFSAAFQRPTEAIRAALGAQRELNTMSDGDVPIRVRMALNSGTAHERDGDYFGPALNRTARLLAASNGSQVLVGLAAKELIQDTLSRGGRPTDARCRAHPGSLAWAV